MVQEERCYVYQITCKSTGKLYIGISKDPQRRFRNHKHVARSRKSKTISKLSFAINKYGEDDFEMKVLLCGPREYCAYMEIRLIAGWKTIEDGYNIRQGGEMAYIPAECGARRFDRYEEFLELVRQGIHPKDIEWLPISRYRALEILREENISIPTYRLVSPKHATRLIEEMKSHRTLPNFDWWPYSKAQAYKTLRDAGVGLNTPRVYKNNELSENTLLEILRDFESKIPCAQMEIKYTLTKQQLYVASAKAKKICAKNKNVKYYTKGLIFK